MKNLDLFLWRHAEAEDTLPDLSRRLTDRGRRDAATVARVLSEQAKGARLIASPARRTRETAAALSEKADLPIEIDGRLAPGAEVEEVMEVLEEALAQAGDARSAIVLVGHQPWVGQTARKLLSGRAEDWSVKKASAWWLVHRTRDGSPEWTLKTVFDPDLL